MFYTWSPVSIHIRCGTKRIFIGRPLTTHPSYPYLLSRSCSSCLKWPSPALIQRWRWLCIITDAQPMWFSMWCIPHIGWLHLLTWSWMLPYSTLALHLRYLAHGKTHTQINLNKSKWSLKHLVRILLLDKKTMQGHSCSFVGLYWLSTSWNVFCWHLCKILWQLLV